VTSPPTGAATLTLTDTFKFTDTVPAKSVSIRAARLRIEIP